MRISSSFPILPAPTFRIPGTGQFTLQLRPGSPWLSSPTSVAPSSPRVTRSVMKQLDGKKKKNTWNAVSSLSFWHFTCVVLRGGLYEGRVQMVHEGGPRCMHFSQSCLLRSVTHSTRRDRDSWEQWDAGCLSCHCETTHKSTTPREHPLEKRVRAWWDAWAGPQTSCVTFIKLLGPLDLICYLESQIMTYFEYVIGLFCELRNEKVYVNYEIINNMKYSYFIWNK